MPDPEPCACPDADEILTDLQERDMLALESGERLWKLYCFRATDQANKLRHRIYTKRKADGRLALITFAAHNPPLAEHNGDATGPIVARSALARVPDLSIADLERLVHAMRTQADREACEELDLSHFATLKEQLAWLRSQQNP